MQRIYDLKNNEAYIKDIQEASLNNPKFGIKNTHGLIGSEEWWNNIDLGKLLKETTHGIILKCLITGHNDFYEFILKDDNGNQSQWVRYGDPELYKEGSRITITFVNQILKYDNSDSKIVITIDIET